MKAHAYLETHIDVCASKYVVQQICTNTARSFTMAQNKNVWMHSHTLQYYMCTEQWKQTNMQKIEKKYMHTAMHTLCWHKQKQLHMLSEIKLHICPVTVQICSFIQYVVRNN